eukprot:CAMPEP_0178444002 /NCGR_PEP_ID=MMETSP0689_2-20121128/39239_1 /TAXON_ID=160604 /ORGANISM="Amphidinium massartii, Strain CS-259" /LENGTH=33 /DNA_ID= /DNA_START= /DNA_END= /DNA_ORIENTATION=
MHCEVQARSASIHQRIQRGLVAQKQCDDRAVPS